MISAVVLSPSLRATPSFSRPPEAIARSLGALVRAVVEGVLRDVTIIGPATDNLAPLADEAGCALVEAPSAGEGLAQALAQVRTEIIFVLEGGYGPPSTFTEEAGDLLPEIESSGGAILRLAPDNLLTRLAPSLARPVGALVFRAPLRAIQPRDLPDIVQRLKIRRAFNVTAQRLM
jgi:hypothetical protein